MGLCGEAVGSVGEDAPHGAAWARTEIFRPKGESVATKAKRRQVPDASRSAAKTHSRPTGYKRRSCWFCKQHIRDVDYKDTALLGRYLSDRGKIRSRDKSGACRRHQRLVAVAIKRAREMALLAYVGPNDSLPERHRSRR